MMNRIVKKSIWLELPETLEQGSAKLICDKPYLIERVEENNVVIWFGHNTNWKFKNNKWYKLNNGKFIDCNKPEYELIFEKLK